MMNKYVTVISIIFISICSYGQDTIIRNYLVPSQGCNKCLQPIYVYDGIPYDASYIELIVSLDNEFIDSVALRKDSVFNFMGEAKYYGIIEIFTMDSINTGLKYILQKTDYWIYRNPLAQIEINGKIEKWDTKTAEILFGLKPVYVIDIKVIESSQGTSGSNGLLSLRIKY